MDKAFFEQAYAAAIAAARPEKALSALLPGLIPSRPKGRLIVVGAGKGAAHLAQAFERLYPHPLEGLVVTRYGYGAACARIEVVEAAHPVPDENSEAAAARMLALVSDLTAADLVVALITGGGSALLAAPLPPMTLADEQALNRALLASGAPIGRMNTLRRHVSRIKGGRLAAAAHPARVLSLIVSDVPGDDPAEVASGPTAPGATMPQDALAVIERYRLALPANVAAALASPEAALPAVTPETHILASAKQSLAAVETFAAARGLRALNLGDAVEGEARAVARDHAVQVRAAGCGALLLSGGETTVTLTGGGRGGRNTEYLLALAIALDGFAFQAFAADTDGVDGSENNAGAFADGTTCARLRAAGADPQALLDDNNAYTAFETLGDLFAPGPSGTNINDLRLIVVS